jgi:hypothetical protein
MEFEKVDKTAKLLPEYFRRYTVRTIFNAIIIQKTMEFDKVDKTAKLLTEYFRRYTVRTYIFLNILQVQCIYCDIHLNYIEIFETQQIHRIIIYFRNSNIFMKI